MDSKGFTLLEVLIVLSLWAIILLLSVPIKHSSLAHIQEEQFLNTLQFDILYIQSLAMSSTEHVQIYFHNDEYIIYQGSVPIEKRSIPKEWKVNAYIINNSISFYKNGLIRQPGSMTIKANQSTYKITFPLGKGRGYIEKE